MKLLYLGYICSSELFDKIAKKDAGLSHARQRWEIGFFSGIEASDIISPEDVTAMSFLPDHGVEMPESEMISGINVKYFKSSRSGAVAILKSIVRLRKEISRWFKQTAGEERVVFTYATNPVLMIPLLTVRKHGCRIISACSEVPAFRLYDEKSKLARSLKKHIFEFLHSRMSGYVFFSKHDNDVANSKGKPWTVCEGMAQMPPDRTYVKKSDKDIIFYAGGLNKEYGICDLVDAFNAVNRENTELWLCGSGNAVPYIEEFAKQNGAIKYLGRLENKRVLEIESECDLLINPRPKDMMLTKYSFPSKTLEYMASGTPAMIRPLEGIPDDYYEYAFMIEEDGSAGIESALHAFFALSDEEKYQRGKAARKFVNDNKTPIPQTKKMLSFLKEQAKI